VWTSGSLSDNPQATATFDRLMHHGEAIVIRGAAYRINNNTAG
jgi:DNA replication protein DnaC